MTQKTSQFNLTRVATRSPISRVSWRPRHAVLTLDYQDRFGDEGAVALAIVDLAEGRIDTFLESCRVIGRRVEDRLLDKAIESAAAMDIGGSSVNISPPAKTKLSPNSTTRHGFAQLSKNNDGRITYEKTIDDRPPEAR